MNNLTYTGPIVEGEPTQYFLKSEDGSSDTQISKWQYDQLNSGTDKLTETDIVRLHQESDPASPLYKGQPNMDKPGIPEPGADGPGTTGDAGPAAEDTVTETTEAEPAPDAGTAQQAPDPSAELTAANSAAPEPEPIAAKEDEVHPLMVDLSDHPVKSESLTNPEQPVAPSEDLTLADKEDWIKKEEARIAQWFKSEEDRLEQEANN